MNFYICIFTKKIYNTFFNIKEFYNYIKNITRQHNFLCMQKKNIFKRINIQDSNSDAMINQQTKINNRHEISGAQTFE